MYLMNLSITYLLQLDASMIRNIHLTFNYNSIALCLVETCKISIQILILPIVFIFRLCVFRPVTMDQTIMLESSTPTSPTATLPGGDAFVKKYYRKAAHR